MMRSALLGLAILLAGLSPSWGQDDLSYRRSVVKVFCTSNRLNLSSPWKRGPAGESTGSGVWLGGRRILTNEHLVDYATQVSVQPYESAEQLPAEVVFVSPEMDLAILELDEVLFEDLEPPQFAEELPKLRSKVRVYGFPEGGTSLSVTEGIVSRIEYLPYAYGDFGLRVQVDAAINPGNSGGPAYVGEQIIGLAFQRRSRADNIGYLIPSEEVLRFLSNAENNQNTRKPVLPIVYQQLKNRNLRVSLGLTKETTGVWVRRLIDEEQDFPLRVGDICTHIGKHDIDNSSQAKLGDDLRVNFQYFVPQLAVDGKVPMQVFRNGEELSLDVPVRQPRQLLLRSLKGNYPSYFVYGPLVFIAAPADFLRVLESLAASSDARSRLSGIAGMTTLFRRNNPLVMRRFDRPETADEELVMVANWLRHRIGIGYANPNMQIVKEVSGVKIRNLKHLVETLRDQEGQYVEFEFFDKRVETLVFDREQLAKASEEILLNNGIPRQGSADLLKIWNSEH